MRFIKKFNENTKSEEKTIEITFSNGDIFELPAEIVALDRTNHYSSEDGFEKDSEEWDNMMEESMNDFELEDWLGNNMNWSDIENDGTWQGKQTPDYEEMWSSGETDIKII